MRAIASAVFVSILVGTGSGAHASVPAAHSGHSVKPTNATFGAAPANAKAIDGRPYFTFDTTPGGRLTDHLAVLNLSRKPETLRVYPVDAVAQSDGTIGYATQAAQRKQAGAWLAIGTPHASGVVRLRPRATTILPVRIRVPRNAPPGDHVGAVVVSLTGRVAGTFGHGSRQKVNFEQRIAVKALFRVSGPLRPSLSIQHLHAGYSGPIDPFARGSVTVTYTVHNAGNVVLGGPQSVSVHGLFGTSITASNVADLPPLLPGASYPVEVRVPSVYPETLMSAKVTIDPAGLQGQVDPGVHRESASVHFLAIPWIVLVVLLLLILGLGGIYERRRRRRKPREAARGTHRAIQGVKA